MGGAGDGSSVVAEDSDEAAGVDVAGENADEEKRQPKRDGRPIQRPHSSLTPGAYISI